MLRGLVALSIAVVTSCLAEDPLSFLTPHVYSQIRYVADRMKTEIADSSKGKQTYIVGIGSSPDLILTELEMQKTPNVRSLPLSFLDRESDITSRQYQLNAEQETNLMTYLEKSFRDVPKGARVVLSDYTQSGDSLIQACKYLKKARPDLDVDAYNLGGSDGMRAVDRALRMDPVFKKESIGTLSIGGQETVALYGLLATRTLKPLARYPSHFAGAKPQDYVENAQFSKVRGRMEALSKTHAPNPSLKFPQDFISTGQGANILINGSDSAYMNEKIALPFEKEFNSKIHTYLETSPSFEELMRVAEAAFHLVTRTSTESILNLEPLSKKLLELSRDKSEADFLTAFRHISKLIGKKRGYGAEESAKGITENHQKKLETWFQEYQRRNPKLSSNEAFSELESKMLKTFNVPVGWMKPLLLKEPAPPILPDANGCPFPKIGRSQ